MQLHARMSGQEIVDTLGLVRREVGANDVNLAWRDWQPREGGRADKKRGKPPLDLEYNLQLLTSARAGRPSGASA